MRACTQDGHRRWLLSTEWLPDDARTVPWEAVERLDPAASPVEQARRVRAWIDRHGIDAVYSLLNVWDGSPAVTAALLRGGCPVPVVRHYKEHYLQGGADERVCLEESAGVTLLNEESRRHFAERYRLPERVVCLHGDPLPAAYLAGELRAKCRRWNGILNASERRRFSTAIRPNWWTSCLTRRQTPGRWRRARGRRSRRFTPG